MTNDTCANAALVPPWLDRKCALFLDFDGTLVDIAPTPDAVVVAPGLHQLLQRLQQRLSGAVAIVSGRPVAQLDTFLFPLELNCVGAHGAERRHAGMALERLTTPSMHSISAQAVALAARDARLIVECKHGAVALHYRQVPELASVCIDTMHAAAAGRPELVVLHGKMVVEVKVAELDKGLAIRDFLDMAPFAGRRPAFFGDDVTDESGFEIVQSLGGAGVKVGVGMTVARYRLPDPRAVRDMLRRMLDTMP